MDAAWPAGSRAVLHVDMDAFYASVEELDRPELRGKPVIVGGAPDARGVVSAASYAARRYGVRSAVPLRTAARLCPRGVFLPVRMERYAEMSRRVFGIFARYSPLVEPLSVDEAFLDATGCERLFGGPVAAARSLRDAVRAECGLTASVGVAPSKFVAKIASDLEKPDALVVVRPEEVASFLAPLPVERMWGVGPRGAERLRRAGIDTLGALRRAGAARLRPILGRSADAFVALAGGDDSRDVQPERAAKSIGHEVTFPEDVDESEVLRATLVALADKAAGRLRRHGLRARTVSLKVRYAPFRTVGRSRTLPEPTCATSHLLEAVLALWEKAEPGRVRLLGVSYAGFSAQGSLLQDRRGAALDGAVDALRSRYGAAALQRGSVLASKRPR